MLLQFSAKNFASFRDELILDLVPSSGDNHSENINNANGYNALNTVAIYGANASGKTNVIKAFTAALLFIRNSIFLQPGQRIPMMNAYAFDDKVRQEPVSFEFQFIASDKLKYIYGFSATSESIIEEYLYCYKTNRPSKIFDRSPEKNEYPRSEQSFLKHFEEMTAENRLFLVTLNSFNYSKVKPVYDWLSTQIDSYDFGHEDGRVLELMYEDKVDEYKSFTLDLLKNADINISDYEIKRTTVPRGTPEAINIPQMSFLKMDPVSDAFIYQAIIKHKPVYSVQEFIELPLSEESQGTQVLFFMSVALNTALKQGKVMIIDELDRSLHPFLVKYLVNLFRDPAINPNGAQLIFTTHDTNLMSLDTFRKDQIFFTKKDYETGVSELYSLDDITVRNDENIQRGYLLGRYGAIPNVDLEELL